MIRGTLLMSHDESALKIFKTPGGSDTDSFTASFQMSSEGSFLHVSARGVSRDAAKVNLAVRLRSVLSEITGTMGELKPAPKGD